MFPRFPALAGPFIRAIVCGRPARKRHAKNPSASLLPLEAALFLLLTTAALSFPPAGAATTNASAPIAMTLASGQPPLPDGEPGNGAMVSFSGKKEGDSSGGSAVLQQLRMGLPVVMLLMALLIFLQFRTLRLAYRDKLTRLPNNNYVRDRLLPHAGRMTGNQAAILLEISSIRRINECYGEKTGNQVLCFVAESLRCHLPERARLFRTAGDTFLILMPCGEGRTIRDRVRELCALMATYREGKLSLRLQFNAGICLVQGNLRAAMDRANLARRHAKNGWDKVILFDEAMEERLHTEKRIEGEMERALLQGDFEVCYQPKMDLQSGALAGAEALVRWRMEDGGLRSPDEFIPVFEKNGFITRLDFHVLDEVCALQRCLLDRGMTPVPVAVNQSRADFFDPNYMDTIHALLDCHKLPGRYLELELTESIFMDGEDGRALMQQIRNLGVSLSLDDFGTGYSSLYMLRELPINVLKLDKGFLDQNVGSLRSETIIRHLVAMSRDLGIENVCEGVETEEQAEFLRSVGCRYGQGHLFSRPLSRREFLARFYGISGDIATLKACLPDGAPREVSGEEKTAKRSEHRMSPRAEASGPPEYRTGAPAD